MGRNSTRKEKLFVVYKVLRCAMTLDDVVVLRDMYPEFRSVTEMANDDDILIAIFKISQAMDISQPCNIKDAEVI